MSAAAQGRGFSWRMRALRLLWGLQIAFLGILALLFTPVSESLLTWLSGAAGEGAIGSLWQTIDAFVSPYVGVDKDLHVNVFSPIALALALLTGQGLRKDFAWLRDGLASAFAMAWLLAVVVLAFEGAHPLVLGLTATFGVLNLAYRNDPDAALAPTTVRANASDEVPMLGTLWTAQSLYYFAAGLTLLFGAQQVDQALSALADTGTHQSVLRVTGVLYLGLALISYNARGAQTERSWRGYAFAFALAELFAGTGLLLELGLGELTASISQGRLALLMVVPSAAFGLANALVYRNPLWLRGLSNFLWATISGWWRLQVVLLATLGGIALGWTDSILGIGDTDLGPQMEMARDLMRLTAPLALGFVMMTVLGLLRTDWRTRYDLAILTTCWGGVFLLSCLVVGGFPVAESDEPAVFVFVAGLLLLALTSVVNMLLVLLPDWSARHELYQGVADTKPKWLYALFWAQAFAYGFTTLMAIFAPSLVTAFVLAPESGSVFSLSSLLSPPALDPVLERTIIGSGSFWAVMCATSWYAAGRAQEWAWRALARWFALWEVAYVGLFLFDFDASVYRPEWIAFIVLVIVLAVVHLRAGRIPIRTHELAGEVPPDGLLVSDLGLWASFRRAVGRKGERAYHRQAVAARGVFLPVPQERWPEHVPWNAFFEPEVRKQNLPRDWNAATDVRTAPVPEGTDPMSCVLRFSNRDSDDDGALDARGCGLRLQRYDQADPLDLLLRTGSFCAASNVYEEAWVRLTRARDKEKYLSRDRRLREATLAGLRRAPSSFASLVYHSQMVRHWSGAVLEDDGEGGRRLPARVQPVTQLVRFRLVPAAGADAEDGLPDQRDAATPWDRARRPDCPGGRDYLQRELEARLSPPDGEGSDERVCELLLQVQVPEQGANLLAAVNSESSWYDASMDWDEAENPWSTVGTLRLTHCLTRAQTENLRFLSSNGGGVVTTPKSANWHDPRSLAASQDRVMERMTGFRAPRRPPPPADLYQPPCAYPPESDA